MCSISLLDPECIEPDGRPPNWQHQLDEIVARNYRHGERAGRFQLDMYVGVRIDFHTSCMQLQCRPSIGSNILPGYTSV